MISRWATGAALWPPRQSRSSACGGSDSHRTGGRPVSLAAGQSAPLTAAAALKIDGGSTGSENVLVLVDTGLTSISAKIELSVAATGDRRAPVPCRRRRRRCSLRRRPPTAARYIVGDRARHRLRHAAQRAIPRPVLRRVRRRRAALASRRTASPGLRCGASPPPMPQVGDIFNGQRRTERVPNVRSAARAWWRSARSRSCSPTRSIHGRLHHGGLSAFRHAVRHARVSARRGELRPPADIDQNRKIVLLFTAAVNELTPAQLHVVRRRLLLRPRSLPDHRHADFQGCAGSNFGEMFYLLAPDPTGRSTATCVAPASWTA